MAQYSQPRIVSTSTISIDQKHYLITVLPINKKYDEYFIAVARSNDCFIYRANKKGSILNNNVVAGGCGMSLKESIVDLGYYVNEPPKPIVAVPSKPGMYNDQYIYPGYTNPLGYMFIPFINISDLFDSTGYSLDIKRAARKMVNPAAYKTITIPIKGA